MSTMSKKALCGRLPKKTLSLSDKVKVLDFKKGNPKKSCREIAEIFKIGKTAASEILKSEVQIRRDFESFRGDNKRKRQGKYHVLNKAMYLWYTKCCDANLYPTGKCSSFVF